ncbi:PREDICTED: uncharacterized protein LOC105455072 [Wasmannia auropunctata]|uniref:uncharacterized protein LOC105455072 n=1 Tax=Wasmannia auropunctata TaxID=64793 RepID=UPI0005EDB0D0|nr:PREDICTED: uncharacterized protein LOC105455072 [Wasmannia auropunctata]
MLDSKTHRAWESNQGRSTALDKFHDFEEFLLSRIRVLDAVERRTELAKVPESNSKGSKGLKTATAKAHAATGATLKCSLCGANHYISACPTYRGKSPQQRREFISQNQLCFNCLGPHRVSACRTTKRCLTCGQLHHTSIHGTSQIAAQEEAAGQSSTSKGQPSQSLCTAVVNTASNGRAESNAESNKGSEFALLATANVIVTSARGDKIVARVLLDQGSELSFITESLAQTLKLERSRASIPLIGIGARNSDTRGKVDCTIQSRVYPDFSCRVTAYVLPRLTARVPSNSIHNATWPHLEKLSLADPAFAVPGRVDLLGADIYGSLLRDGLRKGTTGTPVAQLTALGWIISGPVSISRPRSLAYSISRSDEQLNELVERFWQQEDISQPSSALLSEDEARCEEHFKSTHSRTQSGRYIVRLPLSQTPKDFGDSRSIACRALTRMQRRCALNPEFAKLYTNFLAEYETLEHMSRVSPNETEPGRVFYLPHHGVLRETSATTKLRVVFNGSQRTNAGLSLNDCLYSGPKLQTELSDVLLLWRRHRFVFSADIEKMFRQILVDSRDWDLQRILWSPDEHTAPVSYHLRTVTYGLACAPYLALRILKQLAADLGPHYPLAQEILAEQIYVDDVLSGADSLPLARERINQLDALLTAGGFKLQKWVANEPTLLDSIDRERRADMNSLSIDDNTVSRALGLLWQVKQDQFGFRVKGIPVPQTWTKRSVLSVIARLFDPLGWLSPVTVTAKIFFQKLWLEKLGWDEELPSSVSRQWSRFHEELPAVETISVPRWFGGSSNPADFVELHGFSDASTDALAACVYLKVCDGEDNFKVNLVAAKTRVAPLKPMTVPRLELSAAVLLARLISRIRDVLKLHHAPLFLWTDSTVALTWIKGPPSRWKDFVRNRVAQIQDLVPSGSWQHNPADLASRGIIPRALQASSSWWHGPCWLLETPAAWPVTTSLDHSRDDLEERKIRANVAQTSQISEFCLIPDKFSTLRKLLRVTVWVLRAVARFRSRSSLDISTPLLPEEISHALNF